MFRKLFGRSDESVRTLRSQGFDPRWWNAPDLAPDSYQEVVGESHYKEAIRAALELFGRAQLAQLVREPKNRHDRNAVAVRLAGKTVGYLPASDAPAWHEVLDHFGGVASARASITGGRYGYDQGYFGVVIHADTEPFDPSAGFLGGGVKVALRTLKAAGDAALAVVPEQDGSLAALTVDDEGYVWVFVGDVPIGKMTRAKSDDYSSTVPACFKAGVLPTCRVTQERKDDGGLKFVAWLMPVNDTWASLEAN